MGGSGCKYLNLRIAHDKAGGVGEGWGGGGWGFVHKDVRD